MLLSLQRSQPQQLLVQVRGQGSSSRYIINIQGLLGEDVYPIVEKKDKGKGKIFVQVEQVQFLSKKRLSETAKTKMPLSEENLNALQLSILRKETPDPKLKDKLQYISITSNPDSKDTTLYSSLNDNEENLVFFY